MDKRKRSSRTTPEQYKLMLDFFAANKGLAEGKFVALHGRQDANKKWDELASLLNTAGGPEKSGPQWQVAWRDLKSRTSVKARERRKEMSMTGGKPLSHSALTELDTRVLSFLGAEYVEGSQNCADSIPEEEHLQIAIESGDMEVLREIPAVPNILDVAEEPNFSDVFIVEDEAHDEEVVETPAKKRCAKGRVQPSSQRRMLPKRTIANTAREQFAALAKQNADSMTMLAEATKLQAEATKQQAEAAMVQARSFERIAAALELLPTAIRPQLDPFDTTSSSSSHAPSDATG